MNSTIRAEDEVRAAVAELLGTAPQEVPGDARLVDLGLTSLQVMRLGSRWRRAGIRVKYQDLAAEPTVNAWARLVSENAENAENTENTENAENSGNGER
ncbi:phosphopantetheine-binding protein [Streptomyces cynarae]|uniref:Phosphopantetheine-binding protein n=1 Tax=Streptomyces cynarae TaxID=2981134 RepID=A0ABY6DZN4_9ACTN|nr:phosphopantetheine-binding protein [Streptomyces cynarae]UXY19857.1 phosphopantetheine-binding protein [Streptomyces cynarae]